MKIIFIVGAEFLFYSLIKIEGEVSKIAVDPDVDQATKDLKRLEKIVDKIGKAFDKIVQGSIYSELAHITLPKHEKIKMDF